jgi:hypothetical protein
VDARAGPGPLLRPRPHEWSAQARFLE